jgi:type I restriction enzyme R subunit
MAVLEAKRTSVNLAEGEAQAIGYAKQLKVPFVFLANGEEIRVWEWDKEAYPRAIKTIYRQGDLERRIATLTLRRDARTVAIDGRSVERS